MKGTSLVTKVLIFLLFAIIIVAVLLFFWKIIGTL
jgi:hypothetical protein